jgi:hypothetical protein
MKKFFKCLFDGVLAAIVIVLITIIIWAFLTLTAVVVVGSTPIWIILLARLASKVSSLKEFTLESLDKLEEVIDNAK